MINEIPKIIAALCIMVIGVAATVVMMTPVPVEVEDDLGAASQLLAGTTYTLSGSGITSSATSITVQSLTLPQNDYKIQDSDLSNTFYVTVEPGSKKRQEIISCTTVTQNSGGTATLSGCTRGLSPITPFTSSSTLQFSHAGGSQLIFSDPPQVFNEFANRLNDDTIEGRWFFDVHPEATSTLGTPTTSDQYATVLYVNNATNQGAATATEAIGGISKLATQIEQASSTDNGANEPLVLQAKYATSTPSAADNGLFTVISENDGKISQLWLDLTESFNFSGGVLLTASSTASVEFNTASTTLSLNTLFTGPATTTNPFVFESDVKGVDGNVSLHTCGATIGTGAAVHASTTISKLDNADASNASSTVTFLGFALQDCVLDGTTYVQTSGVYTSSTASFTAGDFQFISNTAGFYSSTAGDVEGIVGQAITSTEIDMGVPKGWQEIGSVSDTNDLINVSPHARYALVDVTCNETGNSLTARQQVTIFRRGKTSQTFQDVGDAVAASDAIACTASWSGNTITLSTGGDADTVSGTAHFYY